MGGGERRSQYCSLAEGGWDPRRLRGQPPPASASPGDPAGLGLLSVNLLAEPSLAATMPTAAVQPSAGAGLPRMEDSCSSGGGDVTHS